MKAHKETNPIIGNEYDLKIYGKATYDGIQLANSGWLWRFIAGENTQYIKLGQKFYLQYDGRGLGNYML